MSVSLLPEQTKQKEFRTETRIYPQSHQDAKTLYVNKETQVSQKWVIYLKQKYFLKYFKNKNDPFVLMNVYFKWLDNNQTQKCKHGLK